jgi:hypothetical protein
MGRYFAIATQTLSKKAQNDTPSAMRDVVTALPAGPRHALRNCSSSSAMDCSAGLRLPLVSSSCRTLSDQPLTVWINGRPMASWKASLNSASAALVRRRSRSAFSHGLGSSHDRLQIRTLSSLFTLESLVRKSPDSFRAR